LSAQNVPVPGKGHLQAAQRRADPMKVVGVVGRHDEFLQTAARRGNDPQLLACVDGAEPAVRQGRQPEVGVVSASGVGVGHAHGEAGKTVQSHDRFLSRL
jgi:hypothetical protein